MKHKCKNFKVCGNYIEHGELCQECKKATKELENSWQTIESELAKKAEA